MIGILFGCVVNGSAQTIASALNPGASSIGGEDSLVFDPTAVDPAALPNIRDLPSPMRLGTPIKPRAYTGIIRNKTKYDLSIPSMNSDATLVVPAKGWIEFTSWSQRFNLTVYRDGKPYYCLKITASPKNYPFMCSNYDFLAEIKRDEPVPRRPKPKRLKRKARSCKLPDPISTPGDNVSPAALRSDATQPPGLTTRPRPPKI
jgi:hypothetical protein